MFWIIEVILLGCILIYSDSKSQFVSKTDFNLLIDYEKKFTDRSEGIVNEYIVTFKNYYRKTSREKYIQKAFIKENVTEWMILEHSDLSKFYPSDFDVVRVASERVHLLRSHPAVKTVSLQRRIQRQLKTFQNANSSSYDNRYFGRHLLRALPKDDLPFAMNANLLWQQGITGKGVKVAVFDTGLAKSHPHFRNVKERTNWTNEKYFDDGVSHGTFVAGVIASSKECLGFAPDVELHIFRVFTNNQVSYTSWFLDAFNYAMFRKINILNLSIGGPDFMDYPFVDKVLELSANKVIMVSAIGNDGPLYGTLNNPGDQSDVIGVGGVNSEGKVAKFSSRGMSTWEIPRGYGRVKPDIITHGSQVKGSNVGGGCRSLSGTSVASPVIAGALALILSGALNKSHQFNPASVKQILLEGATRLPNNNMFEQGYGKLNILNSVELLLSYSPKITFSPPYIDYTELYMWPYSSQPLYCQAMPSIVNVTILNGISVSGKIMAEPLWYPYVDKNGQLIDVQISYPPLLWPWSGWMSIHITVKNDACFFEGISKGHISLQIQATNFEDNTVNSTLHFPITVKIMAKPPRHKRVLWDQYHNLRYPPGYIPRDNLKIKSDPLDWRGDHIHTNFRDMYQHLRNLGYYIEVLREPFTCFNASEYGALLIVDPEEEFFDDEIIKLQKDVFDLSLGVIVFADWYNTTVMRKITFFDENTRQWWVPDTGGANIPALNELLQSFGIALSDMVAEGYYRVGEHSMYYASGTTLATFPNHEDNVIISAYLNDQGSEIINIEKKSGSTKTLQPIIGLFQMRPADKKVIVLPKVFETDNFDYSNEQLNSSKSNEKNPILNKRMLLQHRSSVHNSAILELDKEKMPAIVGDRSKNELGRLAIMGDSNCIDSINTEKSCLWLLNAFLEYTINSHKALSLQKLNRIKQYGTLENKFHPRRLATSNLFKFSKVVDFNDQLKKRSLEKCRGIRFSKSIPLNCTETVEISKSLNIPDMNEIEDIHVLRSHGNYLNASQNVENDYRTISAAVFIVVLFILLIYLKIFKSKNIINNK
uniref:Membrane-bound transcription factor site-1 protease n=1 Tax=Glossina austeni TaxID=7395 RepID=A0A1A9V2Z8_GLOAU